MCHIMRKPLFARNCANGLHKNGMPPIITFVIVTLIMQSLYFLNEPPRGKANNVVFEQVRHKPACTSTEAG